MEVVRYDLWSGCARVAEYNGMAFFTGHVAGKQPPTLREQVQEILDRYAEMIGRFGYKKENLVAANAYSADIAQAEEFHEVMKAWCVPGRMPTCTLVGAPPSGTFKLELALFFACPSDEKKEEEVVMSHQGNNNGYSEVIFHNGFAYFSGVYADPEIKGMRAETENILQKYDAMFEKYGLKKSDMINSNCYVTDMSIVDEYGDPWCAWAGDKIAPAGVCVKTGLEGDRTVMIQLVVAAPGK